MTPEPLNTADRDRHGSGVGMSLFGFLNVLLRRWPVVVAAVAVGLAVAVAMILNRPDLYGAESEYTLAQVPQAEESGRRGGALSAMVGLELYASLADSRQILWDMAEADYTFVPRPGADTVSGPLPDLLDVDPALEPRVRTRVAVGMLDDWISSRSNLTTGTISVNALAPNPGLAVALNEGFLDQLNAFNLQLRQRHASQERRFIEERLEQTNEELRAAERDLRDFLESNRQYGQSPELQIVHGRLERAVNLKSEVYLELARTLEQVRIAEVRNLPVIAVIVDPAFNVGGQGGGAGVLLMGLVVGLLFGIALAFTIEIVSRQRQRAPQDYAEFRRLISFGLLPLKGGGPERAEAAASDREREEERTGERETEWTTAGHSR